MYIRLGNRVRYLQPRSVFRSFRKSDANKQESRAFKPFFALFGAQKRTINTPHGNEIFSPAGFSDTCREELHDPPGEQQTRGKSRFFIGDVLIVLGSRACIEMFLRFWEIFVLLARNFESTKTSRESLLDAYDCCLAHPTPSHTPSEASLNFGGCCCL